MQRDMVDVEVQRLAVAGRARDTQCAVGSFD